MIGSAASMATRWVTSSPLRATSSAERHQCRMGDSRLRAGQDHRDQPRRRFAEYVKLPAKALWPTNIDLIDQKWMPYRAVGNAVHACQVRDLRGKTVAILGCGTIGLFAILIARGMGASKIIGVEPDPHHAELARRLGCDAVFSPSRPPADAPYRSDPALVEQVRALTDGIGVDVSMEMAGFNASLNNAIKMTRRGGDVVLFGVKNGDAVIEDSHRVVMDGIQTYGVVGRQIFGTSGDHAQSPRDRVERHPAGCVGCHPQPWRGPWSTLRTGRQPSFEEAIRTHPKVVISFAG